MPPLGRDLDLSLTRTPVRVVGLLGAAVLGAASVVGGGVIPLAPASATPRSVPAAASTVLVVAPGGSDSAAGTAAAPLATIQTAVDRLAHGGRVELRAGTYHQRVQLIGVRGVSLQPYKHEHPVLSGVGLTVPADISALVEIADSTDVAVRGLRL